MPSIIRKFQVEADSLTDLGVFAQIDTGLPDGLRCDVMGNIWTSACDGVHCLSPDGTLLGKILIPQTVSNLCFGGQDGHRLFVTATTSVYRIFLDVFGAEPWTRGH